MYDGGRHRPARKGARMNRLIKTLICDKQVSLTVAETTGLVQRSRDIHGLEPGAAAALGELLTCGVYMAGCLKSEKGAVSITVKGAEGSGSASVSGDVALHMRGYIDGSAGGRLAGGFMTVVKDDGFFRPFTGACELISDDVSRNFEHYFEISEQIPTKVRVGARFDGARCVAAGGVVMQLLPGYGEEAAALVNAKAEEIGGIAADIAALGASGVFERYFGREAAGSHVYVTEPEYRCNCSREKISAILLTLGRAELKKIIAEQGEISVHCHYCNTDYKFGAEDIEKLFE